MDRKLFGQAMTKFFSGMILDSIWQKERREFEFRLKQSMRFPK